MENEKLWKLHTQIVDRVADVVRCHENLDRARDPDERRVLQQQIDATDRRIDRLVYDLYNLTEEKIAIVEQATAPKN